MDPFLRHRWFELCNRENISAKMEMWTTITSLYSEEYRAYHNLNHIADCLKKLDDWPGDVPDRDAIEIALWFHDIIYDTKRTDNESASAGLVKHYLGEHPLAEIVMELILATRHHASHMSDSENVLCDIDLSILGSSEKEYNSYAIAVHEEFSWVPEEMFCSSRIKVLQSFLDREHIYYTEHYREVHEPYARVNIIREIHEMRARLKDLEQND